jgi:hypothetical protein
MEAGSLEMKSDCRYDDDCYFSCGCLFRDYFGKRVEGIGDEVVSLVVYVNMSIVSKHCCVF